MAYRRPLTKRQSVIIGILWLGFVLWYLLSATLSGYSVFMLAFSGFVVGYPIYKSWRQTS